MKPRAPACERARRDAHRFSRAGQQNLGCGHGLLGKVRGEMEGPRADHSGDCAARAVHRFDRSSEAGAFALAATGVPLVTHIAEDQAEVKTIQERYGASSVAYLDRIGLLDERVIAAHMVWPTERRHQDACPAFGWRRALPAIEHETGRGSRSCAGDVEGGSGGRAWNGRRGFEQRSGYVGRDGHRGEATQAHSKDPTVINAREALEMATIRGARAIHQDKEIGSLEAGKRADLIIVGMTSDHQTPLYNVYSQLVYATKASDVESVMINGKFVMRNRIVRTINEAAVLAKANAYRDRIRKSLGH